MSLLHCFCHGNQIIIVYLLYWLFEKVIGAEFECVLSERCEILSATGYVRGF